MKLTIVCAASLFVAGCAMGDPMPFVADPDATETDYERKVDEARNPDNALKEAREAARRMR